MEKEKTPQIVESLSRKIERSKSSGSVCRQPDLQAKCDMLANEKDELQAQLGSLRAAHEEAEHEYTDMRDAVHCLEMVR